MKVLDLFSGIGGFTLGLSRAGFETVAFVEIDKFCQEVLKKNFPGIPIYEDIKKLQKDELNEIGKIDLICGGFPCQPFSVAGNRKAEKDDRDLWPEMFRVIKETKPTWVIGENVANFVNLALTRTKIDMESIGYTVLPFIIPACAVGAQHRRDRIWIIAHLNSKGLFRKANARQKENNQGKRQGDGWPETALNFGNWSNQPRVGRDIYGVSDRVDRYRKQRVASLGNAVVPQIPEIIGRAIKESYGISSW